MDLDRLLAGALPLFALAMMLSGVPHAFGRRAAAHHAIGISLGNVANWMLEGTALEADIEAGEADAQQALMSAILGGAPSLQRSGAR